MMCGEMCMPQQKCRGQRKTWYNHLCAPTSVGSRSLELYKSFTHWAISLVQFGASLWLARPEGLRGIWGWMLSKTVKRMVLYILFIFLFAYLLSGSWVPFSSPTLSPTHKLFQVLLFPFQWSALGGRVGYIYPHTKSRFHAPKCDFSSFQDPSSSVEISLASDTLTPVTHEESVTCSVKERRDMKTYWVPAPYCYDYLNIV